MPFASFSALDFAQPTPLGSGERELCSPTPSDHLLNRPRLLPIIPEIGYAIVATQDVLRVGFVRGGEQRSGHVKGADDYRLFKDDLFATKILEGDLRHGSLLYTPSPGSPRQPLHGSRVTRIATE
jgi:hypothetical protein